MSKFFQNMFSWFMFCELFGCLKNKQAKMAIFYLNYSLTWKKFENFQNFVDLNKTLENNIFCIFACDFCFSFKNICFFMEFILFCKLLGKKF